VSVSDVEDILGLSPLQQGMLFHSVRTPEAGYYFEQVTFGVPGFFDPGLLQRAWNHVVRRHQILRASFVWEKVAKPVQVVRRKADMPVQFLDWSFKREQEQSASLQQFLLADRERAFDLTDAPLMRVALIRLKPRFFQFVASFYHGILDGWSLNLLFREFLDIYQTLEAGKIPNLEPPPRFSSFIAWLKAQDLVQAESFWREYLAGYAGPVPLPMDRGAALGLQADQGVEHLVVNLPESLSTALSAAARRFKVTLNVVLQTAWAILLARHTADEDVVFGIVVSGRPSQLADVEQIIGLFINTLPVRIRAGAGRATNELLAEMQANQIAAREVDYCALADIQSWSDAVNGERLFDTLFIFENLPGSGGVGTVSAFAFERTNYPLTMLIAPGTRISLKALYTIPRLERAEISKLLTQYQTILEQIVDRPESRVGDFSLLSKADLAMFEREVGNAIPDARLETIWAERLARHPDDIALIDGETGTSVAELDRQSTRLAQCLWESGARQGDVIAIFLPSSTDLVASMLACLKCGAAFLLLDPSYPVERLRMMITQTGTRCLVARDAAKLSLPNDGSHTVISPDQVEDGSFTLFVSSSGPDDAAYVIFTSGSSGTPKGVVQTHRATLNRLDWMWRTYPFIENDVCCQKTALGFVDVIWELLGPVLGGVPLVILDAEAQRDPVKLIAEIERRQVTRLVAVPSLLGALVDLPRPLAKVAPVLSLIISSGETLPGNLAARLRDALPDTLILNLYGSSEVAADATCHVVEDASENLPTPIGYPIDNLRVYLLDTSLAPTPGGCAGEIYVAGAGLARGYIGAPGRTAERFVPDPFSDGERMYRTGDRGRRQPDDSLEFLGRIDDQINLRGYRIEPAEIEQALMNQSGVAAAVVYADRRGALVASVTAGSTSRPDPDRLRRALFTALPTYMVPELILVCDTIPLLPNGKIDRLEMESTSAVAPRQRSGLPPKSATEKALARIWSDLLGVSQLSRDDHFFVLGGHSIQTMQLASRILKHMELSIPLQKIFELPRLQDMADWLDQARASSAGVLQAPSGPALSRRSRSARQVSLKK